MDFFMDEDGDSITVDAEEDALYPVQDFVDRKLLAFGCLDRELQQIRLAVEEIFVNICSYAYEEGTGKARISCRIIGESSKVALQFTDSGTPFNPLECSPADTSGVQFLEREGGFGIHLVRKFMDAVSYEYKDGRNIMKIEKKLSGGKDEKRSVIS